MKCRAFAQQYKSTAVTILLILFRFWQLKCLYILNAIARILLSGIMLMCDVHNDRWVKATAAVATQLL